jgi:hypothetical protein
MDTHLQNVQSAINNIQSIEAFIRSTSGPMPFPDKASNKLVRMEPVDNTNWRATSTELSSNYIAERVLNQILLYKTINASQLIKNLLSAPESRGYGGILFEQAVHRRFRAGFQFSPSKLMPTAPNLQIDIIKCDHEAEGYFHSLSVRAAKGSRAVHSKYLKRYLVPISKTKESVDAVWLAKDSTAFFQATVNPNHELKGNGITELLNELPNDAKKHDERTKNFKKQKISFPAGTPQAQISEVQSYPQYVYYFAIKSL